MYFRNECRETRNGGSEQLQRPILPFFFLSRLKSTFNHTDLEQCLAAALCSSYAQHVVFSEIDVYHLRDSPYSSSGSSCLPHKQRLQRHHYWETLHHLMEWGRHCKSSFINSKRK